MSTLTITFDDQAVDVSFAKKSMHFASLQITRDRKRGYHLTPEIRLIFRQ